MEQVIELLKTIQGIITTIEIMMSISTTAIVIIAINSFFKK